MDDFKNLVELIGKCYEKGNTKEEINAISNFITNINDLKRDSSLELIDLLKEIEDIKK